MRTLGIDLETYSDVPIAYGVYRYIETPVFAIQLLGYAFDDDPVRVVDLAQGEPFPREVADALHNPFVLKTAYNAGFEMTVLGKYFPKMRRTSWECTSVLALYNSLPNNLAGVAAVLNLGDDKQKDRRGKALIQYFAKPCTPTNANDWRSQNLPSDAPDKWAEYLEYNRQDVVVERAIRERLVSNKPPKMERKIWLVDQRINNRGIAVDTKLVENAIRMNEITTTALSEQLQALTDLDNPNSSLQFSDWLERRLGETIESVDKAHIKDLLNRRDLPKDVEKVLRVKQLTGKTSVKKYLAMKNAHCADGRIRGMTMFYGANRTGRWAGRIVQLQNLPKNKMPDLDTARQIVADDDLDLLNLLYDNVSDVLSQLIRTALVARDGYRLIVADYSAIEARVIAWLANETWRQEVFATTGKIYEASAAQMFHVPENTICHGGANYALRAKGKVAELALGFGGGTRALETMGALEMGLTEAELPDIVDKWRQASPNIVDLWRNVNDAAIKCVKTGERQDVPGTAIYFYRAHGAMYIMLPSGRSLCYIKPNLGKNRFGGVSVTHMGMMQDTGGSSKKWLRLETYGGKLVENIVQAVARDCLAWAMYRLDEQKYTICAHVHDEVIIEEPIDGRSLDEVIKIMCQKESWNSGLLLNAAGFETRYYMKD